MVAVAFEVLALRNQTVRDTMRALYRCKGVSLVVLLSEDVDGTHQKGDACSEKQRQET